MQEPAAKQDIVTTRAYHEGDKALVLASWLKGLYYGDSWFSLIPKDIFMKAYHALLERLLDAPGVEIKVACLKDDPEVILGYAVYTNTVLHWIFVKKSWRKIGIAKMVCPAELTAVTHLTDLGKQLLRNRPGVVFNPFAL